MLRTYLVVLSTLCLTAACGDSESSDNGGAGGSAAGSGGSAGAGATSGSAGNAGSAGSGGGAGSIPCGTNLSCTGGDVCVQEAFEPTNCSPTEDPNGMCPVGQIESFCGGAGGACCCDPAMPTSYKCDPASTCTGRATCECIECPTGKQCTSISSEDSGVFRCEEPAKP